MRTLLTVAALFYFAGGARADKIGPPESYKKTSADGTYVFVMLAPDADRDSGKELRETYKQSGLYKNDGSAKPLWTVDWYSRTAFVANDGVHVVRFAGPHTYAERLNPDRAQRVLTAADLKNESVSIVAKGKLVKEFTIGNFVDDVKALPKSVTFFRWSKLVRINDDKGQLEIETLDGNRVKVELATGKIAEKKKAE